MKRKIFLDNGQKIFQKSGAKPPKLGEEPKYLTIKKSLREGLRQGVELAQGTLDRYFPQALAASILIIVGLGVMALMLASTNITGNAIGISSAPVILKIPALIFGAASLILGVFLFFKKNKTLIKNH